MTAPLSPRGLLILEAVRCAQALPGGFRVRSGNYGSSTCGCPLTALWRVCGTDREHPWQTARRVFGAGFLVWAFTNAFDHGARCSPRSEARDGRALRALLLPAAPQTGAAC